MGARLRIVTPRTLPERHTVLGEDVSVFVEHEDGTVVPLEGVSSVMLVVKSRSEPLTATILVRNVGLDVTMSAEEVHKVVDDEPEGP